MAIFTGFQTNFNQDQPQLKGTGGQFQQQQNEPSPYLQGFLKNIATNISPGLGGTVGNIQEAGGIGNFMGKKLMSSVAPAASGASLTGATAAGSAPIAGGLAVPASAAAGTGAAAGAAGGGAAAGGAGAAMAGL